MMDINALQNANAVAYPATRKAEGATIEGTDTATTQTTSTAQSTQMMNTTLSAQSQGEPKKKLSEDELLKINTELNKFMDLINADIQFSLHRRTNQLMVQVVSEKDKKVLREFPSHEMLDIMANIRDYVGVLLDKKV